MKKAKKYAISDISRECGKGKLFKRNYLNVERDIRKMNEIDYQYLWI